MPYISLAFRGEKKGDIWTYFTLDEMSLFRSGINVLSSKSLFYSFLFSSFLCVITAILFNSLREWESSFVHGCHYSFAFLS